MNIVFFLALFHIVHNPADAATPNKPFLIKLPSPPHSQDPVPPDQCKSQPWSKQLSRSTSAFKWNQREIIWSLAVLAYQATGSLVTGTPAAACESSSNEIVQHVMSGRSTRGLFADKAVQTASVDRRATSAKVRDTQVQPKT